MSDKQHVKRLVIKASAGTGKTHNLAGYYLGSLGCVSKKWDEEDKKKFRIEGNPCEPKQIIAVTFTRKAADELKARFRKDLLKEGDEKNAALVESSLIGTVHSVCLRLLQEYALDAGISPVAEELSDEDGAVLFRRSVAPIMEKYAYLDELFSAFGIAQGGFNKSEKKSQPMLDFCRSLIALARINGIEGRHQGENDSPLEKMGRQSFNSVLDLMNAICPDVVENGKTELGTMRKELEGMVAEQSQEQNYDWAGKVTQKSRDAGNVRVVDGKEQVLSGYESDHLEFMRKLPLPSSMRWKDWLSLIGHKAGKPNKKGIYKDERLQKYVSDCTDLGRRVFGLPQFRNDVERLITGMFSFAAEAMQRFSEAKQNAGVVDFADMERMAREALKKEEVRARLTGNFRVLFVDEFQDTSPIQLSIFRLLGQLIEGTPSDPGRIIYVGDDKQSIYGFRGADPVLTRNCTPASTWTNSSLDVCYRSLPELCQFTNNFFSQVEEGLRTSLLGEPRKDENGDPILSKDDIPLPPLNIESVLENEDTLKKMPKRRELRASLSGIEPLHFWLTGKEDKDNDKGKGRVTNAETFASLAYNIAELCGKFGKKAALVSKIGKLGDTVTDDDCETRPVEYRDIAVLCRTNKECVAVANALEALGIPAAAEREGLLEQDDVAFCLNAYRLALDTGDKLAAAELHLAINGGDTWFEAASKQKGDAGSLWEGIPFLENIEALHKRLGQLTPSELLDETLSASACFRRASAKERSEEKLAELEALRALVREYEQAMHSRRCSATAQGWLDWLEEREPGRVSGGENAVQVWTYHSSKGLERKVVILHGLSNRRARIDIFQPRVAGGETASAEQDPLDGRILTWVPNVFGQAAKLDEVKKKFHEWKEDREKEQVEESQRLLYVGMTRACDMLILTATLTKKGVSSPWLAPFICEKDNVAQEEDEPLGYFDYAIASGAPALDEIASPPEGSKGKFCGMEFHVKITEGIKSASKADSQEGNNAKFFPRAVEMVKAEAKPRVTPEPVTATWREEFCGAGADDSGISAASRDQLGNMLHGWFAVWFGMGKAQREVERASGRMAKRVERFCTLWNDTFNPPLWPDAGKYLIPLSDALEKGIQDWFDSKVEKQPGDELVIRTEWPLDHKLESQEKGITAFRLDSMRVDLMAEVRHADGTAGPSVIIDHKCGNYKGRTDLKEHLTDAYGQRQSDYIRALRAMGRECQCWLHLPLEGRMLEFMLKEEELEFPS